MTAEELLAIRGTTAFDKEIQRQMRAIAEHDRKNKHADYMEPDWAWLDKVWK